MLRLESSPPPSPKPWKAYGRYGSVGIEFVLSLLIGLWLGQKGDARWGTGPYLTLLGTFVGAYAGFRVLWKTAKWMDREARASSPENGGTRRPPASSSSPPPPKGSSPGADHDV